MPLGTELPQAAGDKTLCFSVFQNLIKNACEAAPQGSTISIRLHDQSPLRVVIENKGVVPPEIRANFFDKFVTSGKAGGNGLGTYSARMLVRAQHGDIVMESDDEQGLTRLIVTLPRQEEPKGG